MLSLALSDALLCACAVWLASRSDHPLGMRLACGLLAIPALLGVLRFSGLYPLLQWHQLFSILSASAALPLLALSALWPKSVVAQQKRYALIFLAGAMLLGLLISGLGKLRIYDQALALLSMVVMLWVFARQGARQATAGAASMLLGSLLFVAKVNIAGLLQPGDFLHLGMAVGLVLVVRSRTDLQAQPAAQIPA
jgi:hypothetical protein